MYYSANLRYVPRIVILGAQIESYGSLQKQKEMVSRVCYRSQISTLSQQFLTKGETAMIHFHLLLI